MGAYELFEMKRMNFLAGQAAIDPEQGKRVSHGVSFRTVTSMLLSGAEAVLGEGAQAARKTSLAAILNDFTHWHAA